MGENRCKSLNEFLYEPGFQNLVQGVHVLNTARKSLRDVIEQQWKQFIDILPDTEKEQLGSFIRCLKRHGMKLDFSSTRNENLGCGHETCELLYTRLNLMSYVTGDISAESDVESVLQETPEKLSNTGIKPDFASTLGYGHKTCELLYTRQNKISYVTGDIPAEQDVESVLQEKQKNFLNTDRGFNFIWDLAHCFTDVTTQDVKLHDPQLSAKTLIKHMKYCRMFAFKDSERLYNQVLEDIDKLIYAKDLLILKDDLEVLIDHLLVLLSNWQNDCRSCSYGLEDIKKMQHDNADCENFEYKLLVKNVLEIIRSMLDGSECERDIPTTIKSKDVLSLKELISSLHSQVEEMISVQKPNELLELQQKIESLEAENKKLQMEIVDEKSKGEAKMKENRELQDKIKQLEAEHEIHKTSSVQSELPNTEGVDKRLKEETINFQIEMDKVRSSKDEE